MTARVVARSPLPALLLGALCVLGAALYLPASWAPPFLDEGERLAGLAAGTPADAAGYRESPDEFRPMANLLRHALLVMGGEAGSIRVAAAFLHGLGAVVIFLLVQTLLSRGREAEGGASLLAPAAGAILFAVHPIGSEALLAHGAFPIVLATLLSLVSVLLAARGWEGGAAGRPFASAAFYLAALLSDASLWPVAFLAAAMTGVAPATGRERRPSYARRLAPYVLALGLFYICWSMRGWPAFTPLPLRRPWSFSSGLASQSAAFLPALRLLLVPWGLSVDHGSSVYAGAWNGQAVAGAALLTLLLLAGSIHGLRATLPRLALGWYALLQLHALMTPPEEPLSERRLYPLAAAFALGAAAAVRGLERRRSARAALAAAALVAAIFALLTAERVEIWKDPAVLWESAARVNGTSPRPHMALADMALARSDYDLALQSFEAALARAPRNASIQHSIAETYFRKGDYQRALQEVDKAMSLDPSYFPAYITAGNSFMMRNQPKDAFLAFNAALRLRPRDPSALFNMGVLFYDQNRFVKAAELLKQAADGRPRDPEILFRLGMARINTGDLAGAAEALRGCLAESPDRIDARIDLASVVTQMRHYAEAGQILEGVIDSNPGNAKALNGLAVLASAQQQWDRARDLFEKAAAADPDDLRILYNLAGTYEKLGENRKAVVAYREFLSRWKDGLETGEAARARLAALEAGSSR